jgi:hypothetical protein
VGDLKLRALAADHGIIFTPIKLESFAWPPNGGKAYINALKICLHASTVDQ